jgi:hypothetical protein
MLFCAQDTFFAPEGSPFVQPVFSPSKPGLVRPTGDVGDSGEAGGPTWVSKRIDIQEAIIIGGLGMEFAKYPRVVLHHGGSSRHAQEVPS